MTQKGKQRLQELPESDNVLFSDDWRAQLQLDEDGCVVVSSDEETVVSSEDEGPSATEHAFALAAKLSLHGEPLESSARRGKHQAYVVPNGQVPGVYQTW
ncbi:hypothetical protein H0H81_004319 [Sphagnurus paluster]|uniref:Uncharacterized protein n=1 Tax=Sphagnurus paluster TaxID=117069 RepID=A0A9P7K1B0_9AGAR|nr:hypothetical protein H0H81_004319 [Sphagnurus paluster]